jgi:phosphatidylethanolamine/phosphatidyl-N-methylethanolamine N-methyltransferase
VLSECARVLKPGGQIILVNHFYLETGTAAAIERWASHHAQPLGLRPHFSLTRLRAWAQNHQDVTMLGQHKVPPLGVYTLTRFGRNSSAAHDPAFSAAA